MTKKIFLTIFLFKIFFGPACFSNDRDDVAIFLENLMIRECGLYTLLGSKPIVLFNVTDSVDTSEEGIRQDYEKVKQFFEKAKIYPDRYHVNGESLPSFEEHKRKSEIGRERFYFFQKRKLWEAWLASGHKVTNETYKLFARSLSPDRPDSMFGIFMNVPHVLHILKKYHTEFSQLTHITFEPENILSEITAQSSSFWDKVLTNHYLLGLLLGFGEKNAYLFDWVHRHALSIATHSILRFPELSRFGQDNAQYRKTNVTVEDLLIPYFVSFDIHDVEVENYAKEREKIISFLKNKDFIPFVLSCLQG